MPEAVTMKEPAVPTLNVVVLALVKTGGWSTVTVSVFEEVEATPAPITDTALVTLLGEFEATLTSIVSVG